MPTSLIQVGTYSSENFSQQWAAVKANLSLMRTDEHNWSSLASTWLLFIICRISSVKFGFNLFLPHTVKEIGTYTLFKSPLQYHEVRSIEKLTEIISGTISVLLFSFNLIFSIQGWKINLGYNLITDMIHHWCITVRRTWKWNKLFNVIWCHRLFCY